MDNELRMRFESELTAYEKRIRKIEEDISDLSTEAAYCYEYISMLKSKLRERTTEDKQTIINRCKAA